MSLSIYMCVCIDTHTHTHTWPSLVAQMVESTRNVWKHRFDPCVRKIPWIREWQPTPVFSSGNLMDRGTWQATYSPWGYKVKHDWATNAQTHTYIWYLFYRYTWYLLHTQWLSGKVLEMGVWSLGWEDPLEKEIATHSCTLVWKSQGQRRLAGYSPWGCKDLNTTKHPLPVQTVI